MGKIRGMIPQIRPKKKTQNAIKERDAGFLWFSGTFCLKKFSVVFNQLKFNSHATEDSLGMNHASFRLCSDFSA